MVQILEGKPSFGQSIGSALGGGLGAGISNAAQFAQQIMAENLKATREQEFFNNLFAQEQQSAQSTDQTAKSLTGQPEIGHENKSIYGRMNEAQKAMLANKYPQVARQMQEEEKLNRKEGMAKQQRESQRADKYLDSVSEEQKALNGQLFSLQAAKQAVMEGKEGLSGDFWADYFHLPQLKSASGATLDATAKTHLLTSLKNLSGGRPNMFLERQISQAFAMPGGSRAGNLARLEVLETLAKMKEAEIGKANEIMDRYESQGQSIPGNIQRLVTREIQPEIQRIQKSSIYNLQELMESSKTPEQLTKMKKVAKDTPLTQTKAKYIFEKANPGKSVETATEEEIERATRLAKGLGYDVDAYEGE